MNEGYYSAGGTSDQEVEILSIKPTKREGVWRGRVTLPAGYVEKDVVIYQLTNRENVIEYRTVPAQCPHQGADISNDKLNKDGNVYCSLHRRPICVFSEYNQAFLVEKRHERFFIVATKSN